MNRIVTTLIDIVRKTNDEKRKHKLLLQLPYLNQIDGWVSHLAKGIEIARFCEYISLSVQCDQPRVLNLFQELEKLMRTHEIWRDGIQVWCHSHSEEYQQWFNIYKQKHVSTITIAFESLFFEKERKGCEYIQSAWLWNVPYASFVPLTSCALFPPNIVLIQNKRTLPSSFPWVTILPFVLVSVQHQQTNLLFETVHKNTPKAPALNASTKPLSLPTYVFTLWHEHPIKHVQPWLDPLPKLLTRGHCSSEPSAQKQIIIDYKDDMSKWFSKTIAAMLDSSTASLRFPPAGSPDYHFLRQHFNTRKIAESGDENSSSGEPWILDQGYWFAKATEFFILTVHHAKFGLFPSKSKTNYRPSVHAAWSAEDSQLVSFVTALFGIRAKERNETFPSCKSVNHYFTLAKKLFDWNVHMYAFIEPFYINQLYQERSKRGLMHCTVILPTYMEQSRFWPSMTRISELYSCKRVPQGFCPNKDTGLYVFSQATKYDCLQRALNLNTFQSQSMFWIDFGIHHVVRPPNSSYERLLQQLGRSQYIRETHLRGLQPKEIANKQQFFGRLQQAVGGGLIGGPHALVQWLIHEFEREFTDALEWYPVLDEAILGSLALQYPDKILPIHSGHAEMFELRSVRCCLRLMKEAYGAKNWKCVYDIGLELPCGEHEVALYLDNADCELRKALLLDVCKKLYQITKDTHYKNEERGFL